LAKQSKAVSIEKLEDLLSDDRVKEQCGYQLEIDNLVGKHGMMNFYFVFVTTACPAKMVDLPARKT